MTRSARHSHAPFARPAFPRRTAPLIVAAILAARAQLLFATTVETYVGNFQGLWSTPSNWSTGLTPNNSSTQSFSVVINLPSSPAAILNIPVTIDSLSVGPLASLNIFPGASLTLAGPTLNNDGLVSLVDVSAPLTANQGFTLTGAGTLSMAPGAIYALPGDRFTNNSTIIGAGAIGNLSDKLTNNGTIQASQGLLVISPSNTFSDSLINTGLLLANFGGLSINAGGAITLQNTGGTIAAINHAFVQFPNSTAIVGGTLQSDATSSITLSGGTLQNTALSGFLYASNLTIASSLLNTGTLALSGRMNLFSDVTLSGSGSVALTSSNIILNNLRLTTSNIITSAGSSAISGGAFTNSGSITSTGGLNIQTTSLSYNTGLLRAGDPNSPQAGGVLNITTSLSTLDNTGGIIEAIHNGFVNLSGNFIGGTIRSSNGGSVTLSGTSTFANLTFAGNIFTNGSSFVSGNIINSGTITLTGSPLFTGGNLVGNTNFSGGGTINLGPGSGTKFTSNGQAIGTLSTDNLIIGAGTFTNLYLNNSGTLVASGGPLALNLLNFNPGANINRGIFRADGALLSWSAGTASNFLDNTSGIIEAVNGGTVALGSSVTGGTLRTASGGVIVLGGGQGATFNNINFSGNATIIFPVFAGSNTFAGSLTGTANSNISASGNFTNDALVQLNGGHFYLTADLSLSGSGSLTNTQFLSQTGIYRLTNANWIGGAPTIANLALSNSGTISAGPGQTSTLYLATSRGDNLNSGLLQANGGTLTFLNAFSLNNTGGAIEAINGGSASVAGSLTGGTLRGLSGGSIVLTGGLFRNVSLAGTIFTNASLVPTIAGNCTNTGIINDVSSLWLATDSALLGGGTLALGGKFDGTGAFPPTFTTDNAISVTSGQGFIDLMKLKSSGAISATAAMLTITPTIDPAGFASSGSIIADSGTIQFNQSTFQISGTLKSLNGGTLDFESGSVSISCPAIVNGSALFNAPAQSATSITGSGLVSVGPAARLSSDAITVSTLTISGSSTIRQNPLTNSPTGTTKLNSLLIASDTNNHFTGTLDLTNNAFILQSDPTNPSDKSNKLTTLLTEIQSGQNSGPSAPWTGTGITSSTVANDTATQTSHTYHTTLALFDNGAFATPFTTFGGQPVDSNSLLVTRALVGDGNFDNTINNADLVILFNHFGASGVTQSSGDYDGNGTVNNADLVALFNDFGQSLPTGLPLIPATANAQSTPIPEPASVTAALLAVPFVLRRRRSAR